MGSAKRHGKNRGIRQRAKRARSKKTIDQRIGKGMASSLRIQIQTILNERVASASELADELGESLESVSYHVRMLNKSGCIEKVAERPVRGAIQHFYRAKSRAFLDDSEWPVVPDTIKEGLRATLLQNMMDDAIEAIDWGTYDTREDSHMSWTPMIVDEQGCGELTGILARALDEVLEVQKRSIERLSAKDASGISYTVSILAYPAANEKRKVGPPVDAKQLTKSSRGRKARTKISAKQHGNATGKGRSAKGTRKSRRKAEGK